MNKSELVAKRRRADLGERQAAQEQLLDRSGTTSTLVDNTPG
jgi:hypothetical protein